MMECVWVVMCDLNKLYLIYDQVNSQADMILKQCFHFQIVKGLSKVVWPSKSEVGTLSTVETTVLSHKDMQMRRPATQ